MRQARHKDLREGSTEDRPGEASGRPNGSMRHRDRYGRLGRCAWIVTPARPQRDAMGDHQENPRDRRGPMSSR
eukprot:7159185-Lingulodinium_polyedra.AAC.1